MPIEGALEFRPFDGWRRCPTYWSKRRTDVAAGAQPPLKHQFQVLFNMPLAGNALLARLVGSGRYRIDPFDGSGAVDAGGASEHGGWLLEVYPGLTMRRLGRRDYKRDPRAALDALLAHCRSLGIRVEVDAAVRARCETYGMSRRVPDPDVSDALIAVCTVILHREGHTERALPAGDHPDVALEGARCAARG